MQIIPIQDVPNQIFNVLLANQSVKIALNTRSTGLYCDVYIDDVLIIAGVICLNLVKIVRSTYLGLIGDLGFLDTEGLNDPSYPGLGNRYVLFYLEASDIRAAS